MRKYVIWSREYTQWYAEPGKGLTHFFERAHKYTKEEAEKHLREIKIERDNEQIVALPEVLLEIVEGE